MPCGRSMSWHGRLLCYVANRPDPVLPVATKRQPHVVRVKRVTVEVGGQAIVGAVSQGGGDRRQTAERSHAEALAHAPEPTMRSTDPERQPVPVACGKGQGGARRCRMHGAYAGLPWGNRNAWKHSCGGR